MRYIVMNDPHLDVRAPSSRRTDDYMEVGFRKLAWVSEMMREYDAKVLCCTGDWFHKKAPSAIPHSMMRRLMEWADTVPTIYTIAGNHDVQFNNTSMDSLRRQPMGVLLTHPNVALLDSASHKTGHYADVREGFDVMFTGTSFVAPTIQADGTQVESRDQFLVNQPDDHTIIVQLTHASVVPEPVMWQPHTLVSAVANVSRADICHTGHIHEDLGIHRVQRMDGSVFHWTNVGSLTRGSLTEETISRKPKVLLVEVNKGEEPKFTELVVPHDPADQIYDVEAYRGDKARSSAFNAWTTQLRQEINATATKEKTLADLVEESALDSVGRGVAHRILNEAGA